MYKIYGIKNCDTVKKALKSLDGQGIDYEFVDFKKTSPESADIARWQKKFGDWPVNRKGRTFRQMAEEFDDASDSKKEKLIQSNTSLIKRPILEKGKRVVCFGFDQEVYSNLK